MSYNGLSPVQFSGGPSMVTTALGANDGELGTPVSTGGLQYVLVYNDGNSQISPGYGCVLQSGASGYSVTVSSVTSADLLVGVVRNATLTTGAYGYVVTRGITPVQMLASSGSVASRGLIELGANGLFAPVSNTTGNAAPACGQALAAIVSGASGSAFVSVF